ncbi:MAG: DNA primase [Pseudomonadota bacterium]
MRISQDFLAELRAQISLSDVIGRFVSWDRRKSQPGKGDYWACCPFHEEKTPSFHVSNSRGYYHCFGCHASGDHVRFLMDHQGLPFPEAVRAVADAAGVAMPEPSRAARGLEIKRKRQRSALDAALEVYESALWGAAGRSARDYAHERGFGEETLRRFGFGLAPELRGFLSRQLTAEGFSAKDLEEVGLVVRGDRGDVYDRFRGRLVLPIHDGRGRIVGFGGRALNGREPKYLNSPETEVFDKSALLFNAHRARGAAHRSNTLYVVEGYLDAVALDQAGIEAVVASLGTALTETQIKKAWEMADEPVLCFDGDSAGRAAASRAIDRIVPLLTAGRSFALLSLPSGQDPDDVVREGGRAAFEALAQSAEPLVDAIFAKEAAQGTHTPERLAALEDRLDRLCETIADARVRGHYRNALRERLFALRRATRAPAQKPHRPSLAASLPAPGGGSDQLVDLERVVLGLLIWQPRMIEEFSEELANLQFANAAHQGLATMLVDAVGQAGTAGQDGHDQTPSALLSRLPERARMCVSEVWGDSSDPAGPKLLQRYPILRCEPGSGFITQSLNTFLMKLSLREQQAEHNSAIKAWQEGDSVAQARIFSLSEAITRQTVDVAEAEQRLTELATQLRRHKGERETR